MAYGPKKIVNGIIPFVFAFAFGQQYDLISKLESKRGSSRATAYIDSNKIVIESDSVFYYTYLENNENKFRIVISKTAEKITEKYVVVDNVKDNHGGGAILQDSQGILHLFYSGHAGVLYHKKNETRGDISKWTTIDSIAGNFTYPSAAYDLKSNKLFVVARERILPNDWRVSFFKKKMGGKFGSGKKLLSNNYQSWKAENLKLHFTQSGYSRWNKSLVQGKKSELYLFFKNYEYTPANLNFDYFDERGGSSYFISYLFSNNNGETWKSGTVAKKESFLPQDLQLISGTRLPRKKSGYHNVSNILFSENSAFFTFSKTKGNGKTALYISKLTKGIHEQTKRIRWTSKDYEIVAPAALARNDKGDFFILATAIEKSEYCNCTKDWGRDSNILILLVLNKNFDTFMVKRINHEFLGIDKEKGSIWLPATGYLNSDNQSPIFLFTVGDKGMNNREILYNSVYSLKVKERL